MSLFDKKHLVTQADALPGRNTPMPIATLHAVNEHSMTNVPAGMEIAYFAMGCFWGVERLFWQLPGVYSTRQGMQAVTRLINLPGSLLRADRSCRSGTDSVRSCRYPL